MNVFSDMASAAVDQEYKEEEEEDSADHIAPFGKKCRKKRVNNISRWSYEVWKLNYVVVTFTDEEATFVASAVRYAMDQHELSFRFHRYCGFECFGENIQGYSHIREYQGPTGGYACLEMAKWCFDRKEMLAGVLFLQIGFSKERRVFLVTRLAEFLRDDMFYLVCKLFCHDDTEEEASTMDDFAHYGLLVHFYRAMVMSPALFKQLCAEARYPLKYFFFDPVNYVLCHNQFFGRDPKMVSWQQRCIDKLCEIKFFSLQEASDYLNH